MPRSIVTLAALIVLVIVVAPTAAYGAVTVSRAEVASGALRIEGRAIANRAITVDRVQMATSDGSGNFRVSRSGFTSPSDCTVDVNDGSTTPAVARLTGCTVTSAPTPTTPPAINPNVAEFAANVGTPFQETFVLTGSNITSPSSFRLESGTLPAGLALTPIPITSPRPFPQNAIRIQGTPTTVQASTFTLRATDAAGRTATRTYTIRVAPPRPLTITPHTWGPLVEGSPQNLFLDGDGGVKPYAWSISAGALPPGMSVIQDSTTVGLVRIGGTPTARGGYAFTLRLTDALGTTLDRAFTVSVAGPEPGLLQEVAVAPTTVGGATPFPIASVRFSPAPGSNGATVALSSSNTAAAQVPATIFVPAGETVGAFTVTTSAVTASTPVTITATHNGITRTTPLTVNPPATTTPPPPPTTTPPPPTTTADTITISRAEYDSGKRELRVEATSSRTGATLTAFVTSSDTRIGALSGGVGLFSVATNPQRITIKSSLGGTAQRSVTVK